MNQVAYNDDQLLRLPQVIGTKTNPGIIPLSRSGFLKGVNEGLYPQGIKLSARAICWRVGDLRAALEKIQAANRNKTTLTEELN